jgi:hypothetical protein
MSDTETGAMPGAESVSEDVAEVAPEEEIGILEVVAMKAQATMIGTVSTEEFDATQCAIGSASVAGDASVSTSLMGVLSADSVGIHQGGAVVMVVDGDVSVDQGAAQVMVTRSAGLERGGVGVLVAGDASLAHSWVGIMAARNATLSDDSRVVIDTRSALIIGGLLFGGLGLVALGVYFAGRKIAQRMPRLPHMPHVHMPQMPQMSHMHLPTHMPDLSKIELPKIDVSAIMDMIARLRRAA